MGLNCFDCRASSSPWGSIVLIAGRVVRRGGSIVLKGEYFTVGLNVILFLFINGREITYVKSSIPIPCQLKQEESS